MEEARSYFVQLGDEEKIANLNAMLGILHKNLCEWAIAVHYLRDALDRDRRLGRFAMVANRLQNLGIVYLKSGEWSKAHDSFVEARQIYRQVGDQAGLANNALSLGTHARLVGRFEDSDRLLSEALERALGGGWGREEALAREFLGDLAFDRRDARRAVESYRGALAIAERIAPTGDIVTEVLRRLGEAHLALGDVASAKDAIDRGRKVCALLDDRYEGAVLHRVAGLLHAASGDREAAIHEWQTGVNLLGEMGERYERGRVLFLLAQHVTDPVEARKLSYRASACFAEVGAENALAEVEKWLHERGSTGETAPATDPRRPRLAARRQAEKAGLVGVSKGLSRVLDLVDRAARTDLTVIVVGQTGTGKELVARAIHERGDRAGRPFLPVNCGALRSDLALSQLFGHRRGAYTGAHTEGTGLVEAAHTGTLFLDEVGELPLDVQVTLLRFLERGDYIRLGETAVRHADVRVIGATNVDLRRAVAEARFRADLFYRLYEIEISLPPLSERKEDILPLVHHFLRLYAGESAPRLSADAASLLTGYSWPGNIRELENCIRRALALRGDGPALEAEDLIVHLDQLPSGDSFAAVDSLDERSELLAALDRAGGNKSRAADLLGVSRKTLYSRMRRLGIPLEGNEVL
jgi:DNA-binding NtrC family response regulator